MSKMKNAGIALTRLARSIVRHPKLNAETVKALTFSTRGKQFGREMVSYGGNQADGEGSSVQNRLASYFISHTAGPGIWKWMHYFDIYHRHLSKFVGREVYLLEVGIYSGGSLRMWREYLGEKARIYGVDIEDACKAYDDEKTIVFVGDQADRNFWKQVKDAAPLIDIVIDDGGHLPEQQLITLEEMLPYLRPGGVYLCEDIHGEFNKFAAYVHGLSDNLNAASLSISANKALSSVPSAFQKVINSIHLYPFVAVIETNERPVRQLVAPKHGTQWQPFM